MRGKYTYKGFSVIELLAVMAVLCIMMTLLLPAISGFGSAMGRRGAVNVLMNAFEQARMAALESGTRVFVVMRRNQASGEQDSFCVMRERSEAMGDASGAPYIPLTRWQKLPKSIFFFQAPGSLTATGGALGTDLIATLPGATVPAAELFAIAFNRSGQVSFPTGVSNLNLYLAEATRVNGDTKARGASTSITERLSFRRYTGRAQLDYTAPQS